MPDRREKVAIGQRLRLARERAQATMEEAAEAADVQAVAIRAWEAGRTLPNLAQFRGLLTAYGDTGYKILFGANPFEIPEDELRELEQIVRQHGSTALKRRVTMLVTLLGKVGSAAASSLPQ